MSPLLVSFFHRTHTAVVEFKGAGLGSITRAEGLRFVPFSTSTRRGIPIGPFVSLAGAIRAVFVSFSRHRILREQGIPRAMFRSSRSIGHGALGRSPCGRCSCEEFRRSGSGVIRFEILSGASSAGRDLALLSSRRCRSAWRTARQSRLSTALSARRSPACPADDRDAVSRGMLRGPFWPGIQPGIPSSNTQYLKIKLERSAGAPEGAPSFFAPKHVE